MFRLATSLSAWGTPGFAEAFRQEVEQLDAAQLPLQQGLSSTSYATDAPHRLMVISVAEDAGFIHVRAGVFYSGVIAGCSCADDPAPVEEQNEYCELRFAINRQTAETAVTLLAD